jgi:4-coumarate--CoA ligase
MWLSTSLSRKYGLAAGDTVAIFSPNNIWYPVAMMAVSRLGGIVSGASPHYNVSEMAYALKESNAKFLMTAPGCMKIALAAAEKAEIPRENIFLLTGERDGFRTIQDLLRAGENFGNEQVEPFAIPKDKTNGDICAFLSFSSGTTGLPKAVSLIHTPFPRCRLKL